MMALRTPQRRDARTAANNVGSRRPDGREQRSIDTRARIVDSLLALLEEGTVLPTGREIADLAAIAPRTLFVHFADLEGLYAAAAVAQFQRHRELFAPTPCGGPLWRRIDVLVTRRDALYEAIRSVRRAALIQRHKSCVIDRSMREGDRLLREDLVRLFAPELDQCPRADSQEFLLALEIATGWSSWHELRQRSGNLTTRNVMARLVRSLLRVFVTEQPARRTR